MKINTFKKVPIPTSFFIWRLYRRKSSIVYPLFLENKSCVQTIMRCVPLYIGEESEPWILYLSVSERKPREWNRER
jgi:hypothetical protein